MIEASKTGVVVTRKLVVPINFSMRVTGAFYAVYGGVSQIKLLQMADRGNGSELNLFACIILAAFALFGLALCLTIDSVILDPGSQKYEYRKGFGPFIKTIKGPIGDIRAISISQIDRGHGDGESKLSPVLSVRIEWKDDRKPTELFSAPEEALIGNNQKRIQTKAAKIANALSVPII